MPAFRVGDVADADVVTPVPLVVLEPAGSSAPREVPAPGSALIARFNLGAAAEAEGAFVTAVSNLRGNFFAALAQLREKLAVGESQ
ncbi:MAG TPA: hypothetical protein VI136_26810 [Verrucomicrobiae bacterium]